MASFDENGKYIKTNWKAGDKITATKLNKIEESIEAVNDNDISRHVEADARLDALEAKGTTHDKELTNIKNAIADNKAASELGDYEINSRMTFLEEELNEGIEEVHNLAETMDGKIAQAEANMTTQVNNAKNEMTAQVNNAKSEMTTQVNTAKDEMTTQVNNAKNEMTTQVNTAKDEMEFMMDEFFGTIINNVNVGYVDNTENNAIGITDIPQGNYTLRYKNGSAVLSNYYDIGTVEDGKIFNRDFIKENIPPYESTRIGVYDSDGKEVGGIPLYYFKKERGERLYSFGVLSDVHNQTSQAAEPTEDLQRALSLFNEREDVEFTCISGDITETATEAEYKIFKNNIQACSPNTPVYSTPGNHDCSQGGLNLALWKQYTGCERTYEITHGTDHFLFLGMNKWSMGSSSCTPYLMEDLEWLAEKLEAYKNERCFIFTHLFFPEYAGNFKEIYLKANWLMGTQHDFLKDLLNYYTNTIWFSGHSHWKWYLQKYEDNANIERAGGWTVHVPSCASPIDSDGVSTRVSKGLESEGAIIDVYENYIDIRGIDLKNDMYIPTAKYRLDTTLVEILDKKCTVTLNLKNATSTNTATEVMRGESYETTITASSSGTMDITVTMNGVNITSSAVNGDHVYIDKVVGDIVINVMVIEGYSTDLLQTSDVKLNKRWSASSNAFVEGTGLLAFSVPFEDINGRTLKLIGFTEEHEGFSTWYAYDASGTRIGRIANSSTGVVWDVTSLVDNSDGSYDIPISPEIFISYTTSKPLAVIPDIIYITMKASSSSMSSTDGFRILVSDAKEEPEVNPEEPIEGFSTDLLQTCEVKLNQRWSASSNAYTEQVGQIALSVPYSEIEGRTLRLIGFENATGDGSAWYAYNSSGTNLGRIAAHGSGVIWDSSELVDNGDGSYDIVMKPEIFIMPSSTTPLTEIPATIYITMRVDYSAITSFDGCRILVSDTKE